MNNDCSQERLKSARLNPENSSLNLRTKAAPKTEKTERKKLQQHMMLPAEMPKLRTEIFQFMDEYYDPDQVKLPMPKIHLSPNQES